MKNLLSIALIAFSSVMAQSTHYEKSLGSSVNKLQYNIESFTNLSNGQTTLIIGGTKRFSLTEEIPNLISTDIYGNVNWETELMINTGDFENGRILDIAVNNTTDLIAVTGVVEYSGGIYSRHLYVALFNASSGVLVAEQVFENAEGANLSGHAIEVVL